MINMIHAIYMKFPMIFVISTFRAKKNGKNQTNLPENQINLPESKKKKKLDTVGLVELAFLRLCLTYLDLDLKYKQFNTINLIQNLIFGDICVNQLGFANQSCKMMGSQEHCSHRIPPPPPSAPKDICYFCKSVAHLIYFLYFLIINSNKQYKFL